MANEMRGSELAFHYLISNKREFFMCFNKLIVLHCIELYCIVLSGIIVLLKHLQNIVNQNKIKMKTLPKITHTLTIF